MSGVRVDAQERERTQEPLRKRTQEFPRSIEPAGRSFTMLYGEGGRGWLGFSYDVVVRLPPEDSARVGSPAATIVVKEIRPGSPAEKAGLLRGDTIISLNGLTTNERLVSSLATFLEPGDTVRLRIRRAARASELKLIAAPRPTAFAFQRPPEPMVFEGDSVRVMMRLFLDSARMKLDTLHFPRMRIERMDMEDLPPMKGSFAYAFDVGRRAIAGAELQDVTSELGEYFGVERGVLVLRVGKETPAGEAGLRAGDVITKANSTAIASIEQLRRAISERSREPMKLQVLRKKKPITVQLKG